MADRRGHEAPDAHLSDLPWVPTGPGAGQPVSDVDDRLARALELLGALVDPEPCDFDHNHSCQAHGYFFLDQGQMCPNEAARQLIKEVEDGG